MPANSLNNGSKKPFSSALKPYFVDTVYLESASLTLFNAALNAEVFKFELVFVV
ncbi:hypothetical protein [Campylobacter iguaniorum]|uniref:hypothetical protein n=1 Tax=Campylobacter iguaniorum TaxID=1244531 RepID=UPI001F20F2C4|nr:hypothetical protein [Campylobacter iguaniorum]